MHFGEYELSPSLIGLSLLPSPHPEAFQRLLVRSSIPCYRDFNLDKGRSLGFASASVDYSPVSDSLSLRLRDYWPLTSPTTATRRFIMQKARRHGACAPLRPLVGVRFQELFHSPVRGAFHLSLTVLFAIGLLRIFSLAGWARPIHTGFLVSRATQESARLPIASCKGLSPAMARRSGRFHSRYSCHNAVLQPRTCRNRDGLG